MRAPILSPSRRMMVASPFWMALKATSSTPIRATISFRYSTAALTLGLDSMSMGRGSRPPPRRRGDGGGRLGLLGPGLFFGCGGRGLFGLRRLFSGLGRLGGFGRFGRLGHLGLFGFDRRLDRRLFGRGVLLLDGHATLAGVFFLKISRCSGASRGSHN